LFALPPQVGDAECVGRRGAAYFEMHVSLSIKSWFAGLGLVIQHPISIVIVAKTMKSFILGVFIALFMKPQTRQ